MSLYLKRGKPAAEGGPSSIDASMAIIDFQDLKLSSCVISRDAK